MKNKNFIKAIGIAVTVIGFGVSILTDWVNEKKMDEKIFVLHKALASFS